jgi:predicted amidohydrolase
MLKIGFYQFRPVFGAVEKNLQHVVEVAGRAGVDLLVLPELAFTGYAFRDRLELQTLAEDPKKSPTLEALAAVCRGRRLHLVTGFAERAGKKLYNSAFLIGPRGIVQRYRKLHLFNVEKRYFDAGDLPLTVSHVAGVKIGVMICFDYAFPEAARRLALDGADIICHPSNLVTRYGQGVMRTRSIENGLFTVTANRVGVERRTGTRLRFTGGSQIVGPRGELLAHAPLATAALRVVTVDPRTARDKQFTPLNHLLHDRRPKYYGG